MKMYILGLLLFAGYLFGQNKNSSVLSKGDFYKIAVTEEGIHKIDKSMLHDMGINPDGVDANTYQIFGNDGGMLPQPNSTPRTDDLNEIPIKIYTQNGTFDYLIFFAQGPHIWKTDSATNVRKHEYHLYSDTAYYFVTHSRETGKRIGNQPNTTSSNTATATYSDAAIWYEKDIYNLIKSGREWYGEQYNAQLSYSITLPIENAITDLPATLKIEAMVKPSLFAVTQFTVKSGSSIVGNLPISGFKECENCRKGVASTKEFAATMPNSGNEYNIDISYERNSDPGAIGYLNYVELHYQKKLIFNTTQSQFYYKKGMNNDATTFTFTEIAPNATAWNITNPTNPEEVTIFNNNITINNHKKLPLLVLFQASSVVKKPLFVSKIMNQNLHALTDIGMVIICHPDYISEAQKLKEHREKTGSLKVAVVATSHIYNEFSSGAQDITAIRDFCKMLYTRGLKHILLFGSCSYDYKNRINGNINLVPVYESRESLHDVNSFCSDDYYTFYDNKEGQWEENYATNHVMKVSIGRLPLRSVSEARYMVNKLINYNTNKNTFGKWRNRACFLADNGDNNIHLKDADYLANKIDTSQKYLYVNKVYVDAYKFESTPTGTGVPEANILVKNLINSGLLLLNYSGHGGNEVLASEKLVTSQIIETWKNKDRLPFFVTATCNYGEYDNPEKVSGGMMLVTKANGGAIGLLTAARPVYSNTNFEINHAFYQNVFKRDADHKPLALGEVIRNTKNQSARGINNRSYTLLGDPSLTLNYPMHGISTTHMNNSHVNNSTPKDTLKALGIMTITGSITDHIGNVKTDFNGVIYTDVYDKYATYTTYGQGNPQTTFSLQNNLLYSGKATVKQGIFSFEFIVPKDIDYSYGEGKISYYAYDPTQKTDASGYLSKIIVGGSNPNAHTDNEAPNIDIYLNDSTFANGSQVNTEPLLIAYLADESGINISTYGIGHELKAVLDGNEAEPIMLSEYYTTVQDNYKKGLVNYKLPPLSEGRHTLKLVAWDTYNNSASREISFVVPSANNIVIQNAYAVPNPVTYDTEIYIQHNFAGDDIIFTLTLTDAMGKTYGSLQQDYTSAPNILTYHWVPNSGEMSQLPAGYYFAHCHLKSKNTLSEAIKIIKLVLIR
ncbi:MAG: type IX secretion system sortase PorU [Cytophagales bacterium]|nr:type IX secretion system sortase PorU [Cytophagales bacterium]